MTDAQRRPAGPAATYHQLLLRTSRIGMIILIGFCVVEAIAYSPWLAERAPFGIPIQYAGPTIWIAFVAWSGCAVWCTLTVIRGRGAGATVVACQCVGFSAGTWAAWLLSDPFTRDYLGAAMYGVIGGLLFVGRKLARGLLVITAAMPTEGGR